MNNKITHVLFLSLVFLGGCVNTYDSPTVYNPDKLPDDELAWFQIDSPEPVHSIRVKALKKGGTEHIAISDWGIGATSNRGGMWLQPGEYEFYAECMGEAGFLGRISKDRRYLSILSEEHLKKYKEAYSIESGKNYLFLCEKKKQFGISRNIYASKTYVVFYFREQDPTLTRKGDYVTCDTKIGNEGPNCIKSLR